MVTGGASTQAGDQEIIVLGSRIPRKIDQEGPAPVTTITSEDILRQGYQSIPDVLKSLTQNGGETQSQQSFSGNDFTPGAQQVDLRGLGPNHTLVLVNGRRIADFPLPLDGRFYGFLLRRHGLYTWGATLAEAVALGESAGIERQPRIIAMTASAPASTSRCACLK